jgi:hypothetical protein
MDPMAQYSRYRLKSGNVKQLPIIFEDPLEQVGRVLILQRFSPVSGGMPVGSIRWTKGGQQKLKKKCKTIFRTLAEVIDVDPTIDWRAVHQPAVLTRLAKATITNRERKHRCPLWVSSRYSVARSEERSIGSLKDWNTEWGFTITDDALKLVT